MREERARPSGSRTVGRADDLDRQVEVAGQAPDDQQLLVVLLAEDRDVGLALDQQLGDDGGDAGEVGRPRLRRPSAPRRRRRVTVVEKPGGYISAGVGA